MLTSFGTTLQWRGSSYNFSSTECYHLYYLTLRQFGINVDLSFCHYERTSASEVISLRMESDGSGIASVAALLRNDSPLSYLEFTLNPTLRRHSKVIGV